MKRSLKRSLPRRILAALRCARVSLLGRFAADAVAFGIQPASVFLADRVLHGATKRASRRLRRLVLPGYQHPLFIREGTSDEDVFRQVFGRREYSLLDDLKRVSLIVDCGANIGCTAFYYLHRFPNAHLIAVEPDPYNFRICRLNLRPLAHRVTLIQAGAWSEVVPLRIERGRYRDGRDWATQVRPCTAEERADSVSVTLHGLLARSGQTAIDLLKIDIEGAEEQLFRPGCDDWLRRTRNLVIELHNDHCEKVFHRALSCYQYEARRRGELIACRSIAARRV